MPLDFYRTLLPDGKSGICVDISRKQRTLVVFHGNTLTNTAGSYASVAYGEKSGRWHQLHDGQKVELSVGDRYQILAFGEGVDIDVFEGVIKHKCYSIF